MSTNVDYTSLSAKDRLTLIAEIWDSLEPESVPFTTEQRAELDRRLDDLDRDGDRGIPWDDVLRRLRDRTA